MRKLLIVLALLAATVSTVYAEECETVITRLKYEVAEFYPTGGLQCSVTTSMGTCTVLGKRVEYKFCVIKVAPNCMVSVYGYYGSVHVFRSGDCH